jgi:hypothetical protein
MPWEISEDRVSNMILGTEEEGSVCCKRCTWRQRERWRLVAIVCNQRNIRLRVG